MALELAADQCGVITRAQLGAAGITRHDVRNAVAAGRWHLLGRETVLVDGSVPISGDAQLWWAVLESGSSAALDGVTALIAAGMTGFTPVGLHISVPRGAPRRPLDGTITHQPRDIGPIIGGGIPRVQPETASIRAAQWAVSDRQAALILCMAVQQRLVATKRLLKRWENVQRAVRRALIDQVIRDLVDGAHSLGELDFAAACRARGLPEPTRQAVRTGPDGRVYLDVAWEDIGLVVEIDGSHHALVEHSLGDAFRQNEVVLNGETVLRIPLVAMRVRMEEFMDQVERAHQNLTRGAA
ncbi:hypothetical protein VV02_23630 [Luteipulveratus mongoliensis]|uniref:AbiEi antitoxin N-terminal domain-containing protein n=1 Tax=Luteipulveratus mongoliensis TaxID=571913 RepID=A0A0K1JRA7_9MICO|nr:hypothetical protein VV02_23630 [Luteipulveratus mongoliensis]